MNREEAIKLLVNATYSDEWQGNEDLTTAHNMAIKALEQEPTTDPNIPFLMHKEMDVPISECQKAYEVAIDYLRNQGKVKG